MGRQLGPRSGPATADGISYWHGIGLCPGYAAGLGKTMRQRCFGSWVYTLSLSAFSCSVHGREGESRRLKYLVQLFHILSPAGILQGGRMSLWLGVREEKMRIREKMLLSLLQHRDSEKVLLME